MPRLTLTWTSKQINAVKGNAYALGLTVSEYLWRCYEKGCNAVELDECPEEATRLVAPHRKRSGSR